MAQRSGRDRRANDYQVGGSHYQHFAIQPWDFAKQLPYLEGTAIVYIARWREKNGIEDLEKAIHYCQKLIEEERVRLAKRSNTPAK